MRFLSQIGRYSLINKALKIVNGTTNIKTINNTKTLFNITFPIPYACLLAYQE